MAIQASELQWWVPDSGGKLGFRPTSGNTNNLFPNITGSQNRDGYTDYKQLILYNANATLTLSAVKLYWSYAMVGGTNVAFALDPIGVVASTARAVDPSTPPSTYVAPSTFASGLAVPNLGPQQIIGVWIRRTINNGSPLYPERNNITVAGTTPA